MTPQHLLAVRAERQPGGCGIRALPPGGGGWGHRGAGGARWGTAPTNTLSQRYEQNTQVLVKKKKHDAIFFICSIFLNSSIRKTVFKKSTKTV